MVRTFIKTAYYKILLVLPVCIAFVLPLVATAQAAGEKGLGATVGSYVEIVLFKFVNVVIG